MSTCQERRVSYTWRVGETVNSHAFHACIHGFESRTRHHFSNKVRKGFFFLPSKIKTAFKKRGFLCGYKPLLPARVSRRCFHFVQAIAFDSRQPSKGFIFYYFFLFAFSCLYACCSASENGFAYSFTLILSIAISCISCSRIYFATVASFNPTVLT